jgi:ABC-2 type transport system permease protein
MSLLHAEWRRLFKRRFTIWSFVLVSLLLAAIAAAVALSNQKLTPAVVAEAEAQAAREYEQHQEWVAEDIERCERDREAGLTDGWPEDCADIGAWVTPIEDMVEWYLPSTFEFRYNFNEMIIVLVGLVAMYAFLVGASFIGAEWRSGALMNLLLWRPRRLQVLGAKLVALLGGLTGLFVLVGAVWTGLFWLVAMTRGVTDTMTSGAWQSFGLTGLRGLGLVLAAGLVGFALASIGRHIAAALGSAVAAIVVGVVGVTIVAAMMRAKFPLAWVWTTYIQAWLEKTVVLENWDVCAQSNEPICNPELYEIGWQTSGLLMGGLVVVLLGAAMWQMQRRDIT